MRLYVEANNDAHKANIYLRMSLYSSPIDGFQTRPLRFFVNFKQHQNVQSSFYTVTFRHQH